MELSEIISEASTAFVEKLYHAAYYKYKEALNLLSSLNINSNNNDEVVLKYMLCKCLLELNTLKDILQALEILIQLKQYNGNSFPAIYYAMGKAYIKLYRFNSALEVINTGLAITNAGINFQQFYIPMTSITIEESRKHGLLSALMNLHDEASSWHCPDAKCYVEDCQNYISHCLPCRDIFFRDPAFTGLVVVTCSNTNNPCKFKFHPVCWELQKKKISPLLKISDKEVLDHLCFTLDCKYNNSISIITKIEVFDANQQVVAAVQKSHPVIQPISNSPIKGAIKKYPSSFPKLRRPNLPQFSSSKTSSDEESVKEAIEKETRLAKLIKLRTTNFNTVHEKDLEPDKCENENNNLDSTAEILSDIAFQNDAETMQQCRFIFEILHEFIKSNLMVHTNKVLSKWHETKEIMECVKGIDELLDSEIIELLLKSPKFIKVGNYMCIPETLEQALQMFEREIIQQCQFLLQVGTSKENGDTQPAVDTTISHERIVTKSENQTDQNSQGLLCSTNYINENNNNTCQNSNMYQTPIDFIKINSPNEDAMNTLSQTKNMCNGNIEGNLQTFCMENGDKMDHNTSYKDKSYINSNDIKKNNQNFIDSGIHENGSESSKKYPFFKEDTMKNIVGDSFMQHLQNDDISYKFKTLQENYTQLITNYSEMEQTLIKCTKEKAKMENNFKLELDKKNSIMEAIIEERKILIKKLEIYESHVAEEIPIQCETLNKDILTLKAELSRLRQEKLDNEYNIKLLLKEKELVENTLEKSNIELLETIKHCQTEVDKKNTELIALQEKNLEMKKCILQKFLESQFFCNQNILLQGIKHCQVAIEIFDNLNYMSKQHFGFNIISNYNMWLQALNCLQAQNAKLETDYAKFKSLLKSKTEVEKLDNLALDSVNLPPYPSRSISTTITDAFMMFYTHITQILRQHLTFAPSPLLLHPPMMSYVHYPIPPNKSNSLETKKKNKPINTSNSNINLTQLRPEFQMKHTEDKHQSISQNSDVGKENNESIQNDSQDTNNNKEVQYALEVNENKDDKMKEYVKDSNEVMTEIKTSKTSLTDKINSDLPNTCNENNLISESNDVSDNTDYKLFSKNKIKEAMEKETTADIEKGSNQILVNSTDKIMNMLRNKYVGMSDFLLLKSLNDLRIMHNGTLTGMPLNTIMQNVEKYILSHQIDHLCTYVETKKSIKSTTTVLKTSKKQSKSKIKKKSLSATVKLRPLKDLSQTKSSLVIQKDEHKSTTLSAGTKKEEPVALSKCPWDIILKPGTSKNNYGESECVICMENLEAIDKPIYTLDCQHKFHKMCIKEWFQKNQSCPTCRIHCTIDEEYPPLC